MASPGERGSRDHRGDRAPAREGAFVGEGDKSVQQLGDIETLYAHPVPVLEVLGEGVEFGRHARVAAEMEAVVERPVAPPASEGALLQLLYASSQEAALENRYPQSALVRTETGGESGQRAAGPARQGDDIDMGIDIGTRA